MKYTSLIKLIYAVPLLIASAGWANAQAVWTHPGRIIVPYAAGGPTDILARILCDELGKAMGQNCVVENIPGASGTIGTRAAAEAEPDGHTLVLGTNQTHATNYALIASPGYSADDFDAVIGAATLQHILIVKKDLPVSNVQEFIKLAKSSNGSLNYASAGKGSGSHLAMELLKLRTGIDLTNVPFNGSAPGVQEVYAGRIDAIYAVVPSSLSFIQDGGLKAIAVASANRAPQLPNVMTLSEQGVNDADADSFVGLWVPHGTPDATTDALNKALRDILTRPDIQTRANELGFLLDIRDRAEFTIYVASEIEKWANVVKVAIPNAQ